jgi:hypothetical protein
LEQGSNKVTEVAGADQLSKLIHESDSDEYRGLIAALKAREVEKVSQGCPFNRTR